MEVACQKVNQFPDFSVHLCCINQNQSEISINRSSELSSKFSLNKKAKLRSANWICVVMWMLCFKLLLLLLAYSNQNFMHPTFNTFHMNMMCKKATRFSDCYCHVHFHLQKMWLAGLAANRLIHSPSLLRRCCMLSCTPLQHNKSASASATKNNGRCNRYSSRSSPLPTSFWTL
jgi:hypothetical protein